MRMSKWVRCLLLGLALVCLLPVYAFAAASDFTFAETSDGTGYVVTGYTGEDASIIVPDWYESKPVTEIGNGAFQGNTVLTDVKLPSTITRIGAAAFKNCTSLSQLSSYDAATEPPAEGIPGDVNDSEALDQEDILLMMQYNAGWGVTINELNADLDEDGEITIADLLLMLTSAGEAAAQN